MLISNRNPWHRRHDDPSQPVVPHPPVRFYPNCRQDLIDIVNLALQNYRPGSQTPLPEIRGNGSHWALSDAAICQGFFVETQNPEINPPDFSPPRLNRALGNVIPTCLTAQANVWKQNQVTAAGPFLPGAPPNQLNDVLFELVHVEAGMRIYELYSSLDIDERSPLALQTMGAAGGQTIVGAFSTGTHGGDVLFPPLADYVVAIHMIAPAFAAPLLRDTPLSERTPYAAEFWIERGDDPDVPPLVDEGLLQAVYPQLPEAAAPITVLRDNDLFDAVRVSAGRMGLIYSVVLRVGWQYCLEQVRTKDTWSNVKTWINEPANQNFPQPTPSNPLPVDHRFVQVVVNPNAQPLHSGEHTCYVTYHNKKAVGQSPRGRYERRGPRLQNTNPPEFQNAGTTAPIDQPAGLFTLPCSSSSPLKTFVGTLATASLGAAAAAIGAAALSTDEGNFVEASADILAAATATTAAVALGTASALIQSGPLGDAVGSICNWCAQNNQFEIVREIEEYVLSTQQKLEDITAISYAILDTHDYTDQGCDVNIDSLEVFFDASSQTAGMPLLIIYVEKIFQRIAELEQGAAWANGTPQAFAGYIGLRFMSSSKGLIAMQRWAYTCSMEIAGFNKVDGTKPFLTQIEKDALALGGTVHWGQRNDLTSAAVASIFDTGSSSHLRRWRQALSRFSGNGRLPCFSTDFTRQRGLEVVQPTIEGFTVTPAAAPTGTLATVTWLSGDAPGPTLAGPGTTATLTIAPGGYHMPLATVDGSLTVPIPAGLSSFILDLSYTLNSHTFTATRTVQVQGT